MLVIMYAQLKCHWRSYVLSCSVFTPYYEEDVMYDIEKLYKENEDGITILFYLQKIYPGISYLSS